MYLLKYSWSSITRNAWRNRQELIGAGLTSRRDLMKLGLLTSTGYLLAKHGLSSRVANAKDMESPATRAFVEPLPIMPVKRPLPNGVNGLFPLPTIAPNNAQGEGRLRPHQAFINYPGKFPWPPQKVFEIRQKEALVYVCPDLPRQRLWGFDGMVPGPTYHARYGEHVLVRNRNELPAYNGGFGIQQVSTHLHNAHTPSESDGFAFDYFPNPLKPAIANASFYDHHYPNVLAGFASTHAPNGDINESLGTLWYHDHRVSFTAQNFYKGLAGFYLLFNQYDTGDETTGFRLPGVRDPADFYANVQYDIPLILGDRLYHESTGLMFYDLFEKDGIVGDKFLVNGKIQPYLNVKPRRYRFRILDGGPSRFYQLFLTDKVANTSIPFWQIANDGNLLPRPIKVTSTVISVAERMDIVIDFRPWAGKTLYLENRLFQDDGRGPEENIDVPGSLVAPGVGNFILQFRVDTGAVVDNSVDFETNPNVQFYALPAREAPRVKRNFRFERFNGLWRINGKFFPEDDAAPNFRIKQNTAEQWSFQNNSDGWMHPIHVHFEEGQILRRNSTVIGPGNVEYSRKDVTRLQHSELTTLFYRFRDFEGRYMIHCHNTLHEDHAMMLRWDIDKTGDTNPNP
ncbi:MAG: multicopper oxidase family protein [Burkholderiaceae bacterium]